MIDIGYRELNFNISTVALAQMCFERLVLSELVTKLTRKVCGMGKGLREAGV
jgi:hypothetical protein